MSAEGPGKLICALLCDAGGSRKLAGASDFEAAKIEAPETGEAAGKFAGAGLIGAGGTGLTLAAGIVGAGEDTGAATRSEGNRIPQKPTTGSVNSSSTYPLVLR